jgi:hypothetical protein
MKYAGTVTIIDTLSANLPTAPMPLASGARAIVIMSHQHASIL